LNLRRMRDIGKVTLRRHHVGRMLTLFAAR
jgi:hypothetical protein